MTNDCYSFLELIIKCVDIYKCKYKYDELLFFWGVSDDNLDVSNNVNINYD